MSSALATLISELQVFNESHAVAEFGLDGRLITANEKYLAAMGYSLKESRSKPHGAFLGPEARSSPAAKQFWDELIAGHAKSGEYKRLGKGGREVWLQASYNSIRDINGNPFKIIEIATDITLQKCQAIDHRGKIEAIGRAQAVLELGMDGTILDANERFLSLTGYTLRDMKGRHHQMIVDPEERGSEEYRAFWVDLRSGHYRTGEYRRIGKRGRALWLQAAYSPVLDTLGRPYKIIKIATDITDQKVRRSSVWREIQAIGTAQATAEFALDGTILTANQHFLEALGYRLSELAGCHHSVLLPQAERDAADYDAFWRLLRGGKHHCGEYCRIGKAGQLVWFQASYTPVLDSSGKPSKVIKIAADITEQKIAALDRIHLLEAISCSHAMMEFALDGTILNVNERFLEMVGYTRGELVGQHHSVLLDAGEDDASEYRTFWYALQRGEHKTGDFKRKKKDGTDVWLTGSYNPIRDACGAPVKIVKIATDVTANKRAAADHLSQIEAIQRSQAIIEFALDGTILMANDRFLAAMGYTLSEIQGRNHAIFVEPTERASESYRRFWDALREGTYHTGEYRRIGNGGREVWIQASYNPIVDAVGKTTKIIKFAADVTAQKRLARAAEHDSLTGLPNRELMRERVAQAIALAQRLTAKVAILFVDLDCFKEINDTLGHAAGDQLLQSVSARLLDCVRRSDTVCRLGGDEFLVVLSEVRHSEDAAITAQRMLHALEQPHAIGDAEPRVTASIGISVFPDDGISGDTLITNADLAMYQAKRSGRHGYRFFKCAMNARASERQRIEENIRDALRNNELCLQYQPRVDLRTGHIAGAEALLRWHHPILGVVPPSQFVPIAESNGLMVAIGSWAMRECCRQTERWTHNRELPLRMTIDVSGTQIQHESFAATVATILRETCLDPDCLQVTLTDSCLMKHVDKPAVVSQALRQAGIHVAVSASANKCSNPRTLVLLGVDTFDLDRSLVQDIATTEHGTAVAVALMSMARSLKLRVTAVGVEAENQLTVLNSHLCDEAQGCYFRPPLLADQFSELLKTDKPLFDPLSFRPSVPRLIAQS